MASPEITLTHLDEPLFDGADATKRDLVDYLEAVGDRFVSVLSGRPLSVIRVRAGQRPFMQKNVPAYAPPWIKTVSMWAESSHREVRYALCEDKPTLIWFANQPAGAPRRAGLVPGGLGFAGRCVAWGLHGAERGAAAGRR